MGRKTEVLPEKIKIGPHVFTVISRDQAWFDENRMYGRMYSTELTIEVCLNFSPTVVLDTFLHEVLHAVYFVYGMECKDNEERTVGVMSTGLTQVLVDNPTLLKCINKLAVASDSSQEKL